MTVVTFENRRYELDSGESVLLGLQRHGVSIPSSCCSGVCQTCLLLAVKGTVPAEGQKGLKPTLQKQNFFLACICKPTVDIEIALPGDEVRHRIVARVVEKEFLNVDIFRLRLPATALRPTNVAGAIKAGSGLVTLWAGIDLDSVSAI